MTLVWRGDELKRRMARAQRGAIDELAGEAAADLRRQLPKRSGRLSRSAKPVKTERTRSGYSGGVSLKFYGVLGKNRRIFKAVERKAQSKLADRIADKFRSDPEVPKAEVVRDGLYRPPGGN